MQDRAWQALFTQAALHRGRANTNISCLVWYLWASWWHVSSANSRLSAKLKPCAARDADKWRPSPRSKLYSQEDLSDSPCPVCVSVSVSGDISALPGPDMPAECLMMPSWVDSIEMQWHSRREMFAEPRVGVAFVCPCEVHMVSDQPGGRVLRSLNQERRSPRPHARTCSTWAQPGLTILVLNCCIGTNCRTGQPASDYNGRIWRRRFDISSHSHSINANCKYFAKKKKRKKGIWHERVNHDP